MQPTDYRRFVEARCFNLTTLRDPYILGQRYPIGLSIDYLISLIETIENRLPHLPSKEILVMILKRYIFIYTTFKIYYVKIQFIFQISL